MSRNRYGNTQMQNFWKETIEKEAAARLLTFAKLTGQPRTKARQLEVFRKKIEDNKPSDALLERLPQIHAKARDDRKKACLKEAQDLERDREMAEALLLADPEMRPVTPEIRKTLYEGFTREGKGRYFYLRQRYDKNPEDKFSFPTCSSWDYGWRLNDVMKKEDIRKPTYGKYRIVENTFYTRNGLMSSCNRAH